MASSDDELQTEVDKVVTDEADATEETTDNGGDGGGDDASQEDDDASENRGNGSADASASSNSDADDDESVDDEDDEDDFDPFRGNAPAAPQQGGAPQPGSGFDIRKLPRDADGNIDVVEANNLINQWHKDQLTATTTETQRTQQITESLTSSWNKGGEKYPHVLKNPKLRKLALRIHMSSIPDAKAGTGRFISPMAAMREVDAMYQSAVKSAGKQYRSKRTVERTAAADTGNGGKSGKSESSGEYTKAKKMSQSGDPVVAQQGRMKIIQLRRAAQKQNS